MSKMSYISYPYRVSADTDIEVGWSGEKVMRDEILAMLGAYADGAVDLDSLEDSVIPLMWEADGSDLDLIDRVAAEMACVKDGSVDEATFRVRAREIAGLDLAATG